MTPERKVYLRTWRGPGAPGGWHVAARVCNRHGHIKTQFDARLLVWKFMKGRTFASLAKGYGIPVECVEEVIRQVLQRRKS